jgi:Flp pilus assembly pilin Flp
MLARLIHDEAGMVSTEYALLLALLVSIGLVTWIALGAPTRTAVGSTSNAWPPAG